MFISASLQIGNNSLVCAAYDVNYSNKSSFKEACNGLGHVFLLFYFMFNTFKG